MSNSNWYDQKPPVSSGNLLAGREAGGRQVAGEAAPSLAGHEHEWHVLTFLPGAFEDVCVTCGKRRIVRERSSGTDRSGPANSSSATRPGGGR